MQPSHLSCRKDSLRPHLAAPFQEGVAIHRLSSYLQGIWRKFRAEPRFRDPVSDFHISATSPQALLEAPPIRSLHGPYLSEHGNYVSLHLGGSTADGVHAIMDRTAPVDLVFSYTQIMAGFERFGSAPRTIAMLGLGGGSLAKHCYHRFPETRIVVAEISPEVIALRRHFLIPEDDGRFSVLRTEGARFVKQSREAFDVLLIDAFDEAGHLPHFGTTAFYRDCLRALTAEGVLVLNFSGDTWRNCFRRLDKAFRHQIVLYRCPDGDNIIAFATKHPLPNWVTKAGTIPGAEG